MEEKRISEINNDVYFILTKDQDNIIDEEFTHYIGKTIQENQEKESAFIVLDSEFGKITCGQRLIEILKENYKTVQYYIPKKAGEASTLMALAADKLYLGNGCIIRPCDPNMIYKGEKIPTYIIREYLKKCKGTPALDPKDEGSYYSAISQYKNKLYDIFPHDQAVAIEEFMIENLTSHDQILNKEDLEMMGVNIEGMQSFDYKPIFDYKTIDDIYSRLFKWQNKGYNLVDTDYIVGNTVAGPKTGYVYQTESKKGKIKSKRYNPIDSKLHFVCIE